MMWNEKRVSIIVLIYNGMNVLPRSLSSIFQQNYPNLEVILSDDGSKDFDRDIINRMIDELKTPNIQCIRLLRNDENLGTVQNLRRALSEITGEYYMTIGADDALASPDVISSFMKYAYLCDWEPLLYTGQMIMRDSDGICEDRNALDREDIAALRSRDVGVLRTRLKYKCCIATVATLYRKDFPKAVGAYDPSYRYYEDYPAFIRMARKGITPVYVDKIISIHHSGGIANGGNHEDIAITDGFHRDRRLFYQKEIRPYLYRESRQTRILVKKRYYTLKRDYIHQRYQQCKGLRAKLKMLCQHPWVLLLGNPRMDILQKRLFKMGIACLLLFGALEASALFPGMPSDLIGMGLASVFCCTLLFSTVFWIYRLGVFLKNLWYDTI